MTTKTCVCGAVYEVGEEHYPMSDRDSYDCDVCGHRLDSWNSSTVPVYTLVKRPSDKPLDSEPL